MKKEETISELCEDENILTRKEKYIYVVENYECHNTEEFKEHYKTEYPDENYEGLSQSQISRDFKDFHITKNDGLYCYDISFDIDKEDRFFYSSLTEKAKSITNIRNDNIYLFTINTEPHCEQFIGELIHKKFSKKQLFSAIIPGISSVTVICRTESDIKKIRTFIKKSGLPHYTEPKKD